MENNKEKKVYKFKQNKNQSKVKNGSKVRKILTINDRLKRMLLIFFLIFFLLVGRLGWLQIVQGSELKESMYRQLTTSEVISPKRGTIYDSTG